MPFWCPSPYRIRNYFKRHSRALDTPEPVADDEDCLLPEQTPPKQTPPQQIPPQQTPPKQAPPKQTRPKQTPPKQTPPKQTPRTHTSPWASIPSDVLCYICDEAFTETSVHYGVEVLALVCRHWYQITTSYGRPWSIIRIDPNMCRSTVYRTAKGYVKTRLKFSYPYPLDVAIHPVSPDWSGLSNHLSKDLRSAIHAVAGEGAHTRRWAVLSATVHPFVRARLQYPTPILRRVTLDGINQYGWDLGSLFTVAPELRSLSISGRDSIYFLYLPASTSVTLNNVHLKGFSIYTCVSILEKLRRLTTLEFTGTWSNISQRAPATLPTVRTLILNARGPISVIFSAIIWPALVELTLIGGGEGTQNVIDNHSAFKLVATKLETLRLEFLHFDNQDHLKNTLVAASKVKKLVMRDITYSGASVGATSEGTTLKSATLKKVEGWISGRRKSNEPDYVTLLKDPLIFPELTHCTVDNIAREDLVVLRRPRDIG